MKVINTGSPIFFSDHPFTFPVIKGQSVAVFDVSPVEPYISATLLPEPQYRTFENGKKFLTGIYEVFGKSGFTLVWKRKRSYHSIHDKEYVQFCDDFEKLPNVVIIHPEVSAFHVIDHCDYCISMPFTSTAFVADYFKKPSVFYDATQKIFTDDRGAQGIQLISGIEALHKWKDQLIK